MINIYNRRFAVFVWGERTGRGSVVPGGFNRAIRSLFLHRLATLYDPPHPAS